MGMFTAKNKKAVLANNSLEVLRAAAIACGLGVSGVSDDKLEEFLFQAILRDKTLEARLEQAAANHKIDTMAQQTPAAPVAAPLAAPALTEVTLPRRNTISGLGTYSITSDTYEPRAAHYHESAGHVPEP